jgi:hypothetical protein
MLHIDHQSPVPPLTPLERSPGDRIRDPKMPGRPVAHLPARLNPRPCLGAREDGTRPLHEVIKAAGNGQPVHAREQGAVAPEDPASAEGLNMASGTPLLGGARRVAETGFRPVEVGVRHYRDGLYLHRVHVQGRAGWQYWPVT